ncbi:putative leucine-rich repeat receptor-like protein kinase [Dorcoceras hygrometricum]|uniref:Putative leucine-rich repeat receptor-like protein kinase n=1 Tax=Dorcoceras hygrometricum TaxID=472368 RepID=A0A2Z6ZYA9_9LAMI|nr:putative leucine-rich repeat receptor-like protein kinase [Dorcoceras hygrometricum]
MSNVEQEADNSKRNSEESDVVLKIQQMLDNQTQATAHPVASYSGSSRELQRFVYPVDMESSRKKADVVESYNPDARYPVAVFEASAVAQRIQRNQRSRWKESMAEIESCKLPQFKGTRFVLFWEIVQFTEERCTEMERRQFGLDKRRKDLNLQSNGHISNRGYICEKRH